MAIASTIGASHGARTCLRSRSLPTEENRRLTFRVMAAEMAEHNTARFEEAMASRPDTFWPAVAVVVGLQFVGATAFAVRHQERAGIGGQFRQIVRPCQAGT